MMNNVFLTVNDIKILKTLENGYYYIECTPKKNDDSSCG